MGDTTVGGVLSGVFGVAPSCVDHMADTVVPRAAAYAWNQALMDLGATLCRAARPLCLVCPLLAECGGPAPPRARANGGAPGPFRAANRYQRRPHLQALRQLAPSESRPLA